MCGTLRVAVLGFPAVSLDGETIELRPRELSVVAALAVGLAEVPSDVLAERIWSDPPPSARKSIQNHVARIRTKAPELIATTGSGYVLGPEVEVDVRRFESLLAASPEPAPRRAAFTEALDLWRGPPFGSLTDHWEVVAARNHLCELHSSAEEQLVALELLHGVDATADAERLVAADPFRERRWWLLILARYRAGLRRGALEAFQTARATLVDRSGLEPGADLRALDSLVLADDPLLLGPALLIDLLSPEPPMSDQETAESSVITGREPELADLLEITGRDKNCTVAVVGEAGIGKTSLGSALKAAHRARGGETLWTSGSRTPDGPLAPVMDLIEDVVARHVGPVPPWLASEGSTRQQVSAQLRARTDRTLVDPMAHMLAELLASLGTTMPLLVIVDDGQWVPPSSARALADACAKAGCHLVLLARPGPRPAAFEDLDFEVNLGALTPEAVARHLATVTTQLLDEGVVSELHRRCGGNPLLLGELVRSMAENGAFDTPLTVASLRGSEGLSSTVADLARQRLSDLAQPSRQVVEAASVVGATFDEWIIDELVGAGAGALAAVQAAGIATPTGNGSWQFRHELIRDAIYADLNPAVRSELHASVAASLESTSEVTWDQIVHHRLRSESLAPEATMSACRMAAGEASAQFAHREAALHLERLGHLLVRHGHANGPEALDVEISRGEALHFAGDPAAIDVLLAAADQAEVQGEADRFGRALLCLSRLGPNTDASAPAPDLAERIDRALTASLTPAVRAELAGAASLLHSISHDQQRCQQLFEHAVDTARTGAPEVLHRVLPFAYLGIGHPRDLARRAAIAEELHALTEHEPAQRFSALHLRYSVEVQRGSPRFRSTQQAMSAMASEMPDPGHRWTDAYTQACSLFLDGDMGAAEDAIEASLAVEGIAHSRRLATYGVQLVGLRRADGRLAELDETVRRLAAEQPDVAGWKVVEVACAAASGDRERAVAGFDRLAVNGFAGLPDDYTHSAAALLVADAVLSLGDVDRMRAVVPILEPLAGLLSWTGTTTLGPIDLVYGPMLEAVGQRGPARRALQRARATGRRMKAPRFEAAADEALEALRQIQ